MGKHILVTGGAGFIGSHIVDGLLAKGHQVRVFDNLDPQVHGANAQKPDYLNPEAEFIQGDVRDRDALQKALDGIEVVYHEAAAVGVGQSMYQIRHYMDVNTVGGATLLDILANEKNKVEKLVVASSMSIYGEGKYNCPKCGVMYPRLRPEDQLARGEWEVFCPQCHAPLIQMPTDETKPLMPTSIYAISKRDHEEMFLSFGNAYGISTTALRYFNVYGDRQSLSNPYTGVAAIFSSRILNNNSPVVYEDGLQSRDFIHVSDIVKANILSMEKKEADYEVFNVGSGIPKSIKYVSEVLIEKLGKKGVVHTEIANKYRKGDIRYCYADITKIKTKLGFAPSVTFEEGMVGLTQWVAKQTAVDAFEKAKAELESRGLTS
jgi:dTDP-L-rhamnose 4-epimerase